MENKQDKIYYASRKQLITGLLCAALLIAVGFFNFFYAHFLINNILIKNILKTIGVVNIIFFTTCLIYICRLIIQKVPTLEISKKGITDRVVGLIYWEEIKEVIIYTWVGKERHLGVILHDQNKLKERLKGIKKLIYIMNSMSVFKMKAPINISQSNVNIDLENIKEEIENRITIEQ